MSHAHEIAFIDPAIADFETLLSGIRPDVEAIVLSQFEPAIAQMARALEGRTKLDGIHVIAHGKPGEVNFAAGALSVDTIDDGVAGLERFGAALCAEKALSIWACEAGAGELGAAFTNLLVERTGARVATANGLIGAAAQGGTWALDSGVGSSRPPLTADGIAAYAGVLATFTGTNGNDVANATTGTLTGFSGGTVAQLQDNIGDTFNGGTGADTIVAGSGDDTINIANGQFVAGESIQGGANSGIGNRDQIVLTAATTVDFSLGTVAGIETLTGSTGNDTVTMTAAQLAAFSTVNLNGGTDVLNVLASGNISALAVPTITNVETGNLTGTAGTDTVTLSGAQLNAILIGAGTINLGAGTGDTINLTSTSTDLNTLGATNASIAGVEAISASGAAAGVTILLNGQTEAFAITGSAQADIITGGTGADTIVAGSGDDTINLANGQFVAGESIQGGADSGIGNRDQLVLTAATTVDFSLGTLAGIETLTGSTGNDTVTMTAAQLAAFSTVNLGIGTDVLNVLASGNISALAAPTITNVETGNLTGTTGTDTVTLSGAQLNAILIGAGTINLGAGTGDTINLTSTSADLNTLGATNASIAGVEAISASGAAAGVTITLNGQTEAFAITGSAQADIITGGTAADTIVAGSGDDTINIANGQFVAGESIQGGADSGIGNRDQLVLTAATTVDFSLGTVSGIETLTGSTGNDTVTMTAAQLAAFSTVNLGIGTDVLNVLASGNMSALATPTITNVETGNLTGTAGADTVTLSGAQLDAILIGAGTIDLGAGTGDTINLTSTSADLNTRGATNASIAGVEAISASGAAAGVTITLNGQTEAFAITGSAQADIITGGSGADTIVAGSGDDTINIANGQFVAGESIQGGADSGIGNRDQIVLTAATTVDFSLGTVAGIETLTGSTGNDTVTMTAAQLAAFSTVNLGIGTDVLNVVAGGNISALAVPTITNVETGNLTGTAGTDTVTLSGAQLDAILNGAGTIDLGAGTGDTINLTSTSADINTLGETNASIAGVEAISASGAAAGVTILLNGQTEAFAITGSAQADIITGGSGADTILGGLGADTLNGGAGNDTITLDDLDISVDGGADIDTLVVLGAATINLSLADQSAGAANVTGFENVNASASSATVNLIGNGAANILTGGSGADTILGGGGADAMSGGAGNDTMTYDGSNASIAGGADIDTLVVNGAATINLSLADQSSGDTANTTGFENVNASGSNASVVITGDSGANVLVGGSANDTFTGGAGNDAIDGGAGTGDKAVFSGARANYTITLAGANYTVADNRAGTPDGTDTVTNVENFQFSDGTLTESQLNAPPATPPNKIALENMKQGNPKSEWGIDGDGDANIQGFATEISTNVGGTVDFKIATESTNYRIEIYRLGYYGGDGARKVATIEKDLAAPQFQPHPMVDYESGLIDCANWNVSASWQVPPDAVSGVYIAKLIREDGTVGASHIPFIVRDDASTSDIVFQTSDTTWQAYNAWGGASLYTGNIPNDPERLIGWEPPNCSCGLTAIGRASAVSYNRPIITNTSVAGGTHDFIFGVEHSAIRWLEQNGYDVSYISGVDSARNGTTLLNHDAFLSVGHDEYWSAEQRANVEAARDAGVNLAFWSGNEMYWKVQWQTDANGNSYRIMVCYKETWGLRDNPTDIATSTWRDERYADPGQEPENSLTGQSFSVDSYRLDTITVPYEFSNLRFWRNTDVADLNPGEVHSLEQNLLGYEWDSDIENGFRPDGMINMSLSTVNVQTYLRDYGNTVGAATATHQLTMYRAESGALVFGAGTVFWSWGLDAEHEGAPTPIDPNVRQAMVNMFADMGIQPTTIEASLLLATQSTDFIKPTSTITSPNLGASFIEGQHVSITGTAVDLGGGVIAGIEVSVDGGVTWFKAKGRESWTFDWNVQASGTYQIKSRAVDDSLNMETPSVGKQVSVNLPTDTSSIWTLASTPAIKMTQEESGVELGVKFKASTGGTVTAIRFYKGFYNIGSHPVSLWSSTGQLLGTGTAVNESITGWQTVYLNTPVHITAGTTYVASYHSDGYYSITNDFFNAPVSNGLLSVEANGAVYAYGAQIGFPGNSSNGNYWVDVVFQPEPNIAPVAVDDNGFTIGQGGVLTISFAALTANDTDGNNDALTVSAVSGALNGTVTLDTVNGNVIFTPNAGYNGPAQFDYTVRDVRGGTDVGRVNVTVDSAPAGVSLFQPGEGPASYNAAGPSVELGMKFMASRGGTITGISFYKAAGDTGTHTGSLWTLDGTNLGTVTFTNESTSGWQTAKLVTPISINANTTYIVSYHTNGAYAFTPNYFTATVVNGRLTAPSSSASGGNGVYGYGAGTPFPNQSYNASNYWVDVVYNASTVNGLPVAVNDNDYFVVRNDSLVFAAAALTANDSDPDDDPLSITDVDNAVNGSVNRDAQTGQITFTPTTGFVGTASFRYTVSDGTGTSTATVTMTVTPPDTSVGLFASTSTPSIASNNDPSGVELGVRFTVGASGEIVGLRYYKSAQDTGTHTGSLWTAGGTLLTRATFTNETASGWQTVTFSQPITVAAGTTLVASYHSNGFYASTPNYFANPVVNGQLTAPSGQNGLYGYGSSSVFPTSSYNNTNYWIDVRYNRSTVNSAPVAVDDPGHATDQDTALVLAATTLTANDQDADNDPLVITGVSNFVNGTASFNAQTNQVTFTPLAGYSGAASFQYTISDGNGGTSSAQVSLNVRAPSQDQNLFGSTAPTIVNANDSNDATLGMKFTANVDGAVTGIRFYKAVENVGPHTAQLWTASGTLLASATFTSETASGWQYVDLPQDIDITANETYVVSYHTQGFYSATPNLFASDVTNGNLTGLASGLSGGNGTYAYGSSPAFPTSSWDNTSYGVDVAFRPTLAAA